MTLLTKRLAMATVLAAMACDSSAQFGGGAAGFGGMRRGKGADGQSARTYENQAPVSSRIDQISGKLYDLRIRLLITPEQVPAWETFYAKYFEFATTASRVSSEADGQSALQVMQRQLASAQDRFVLMENLYEASKALYSILTPEQQRMADQWLPRLLLDGTSDREQRSANRDANR